MPRSPFPQESGAPPETHWPSAGRLVWVEAAPVVDPKAHDVGDHVQ